MMTVRFPSGFSIQYNTANYVSRNALGFTDLYTRKDGNWIAQVPTAGAMVAVVPACRTYSASGPSADVAAELRELRKQVEGLKRKLRKIGAIDG